MKTSIKTKLHLAVTIATLCLSSNATATIILDGYEGASSVKSAGDSYGDVIGNTRDFQINYMDVSLVGNTLHVSIDTTFGGKGDNKLFSDSTNTPLSKVNGISQGIGYGDLFLSSSWTPCLTTACSSPYVTDDNDNGTIWTYGFSLDNRWGIEDTTHNGTLYELNSANNNADAYLSDDFLSSSTFTYRNGQEVAVDIDNGNVNAVGSGTWDTTANKVNFEIDLTNTGLANSSSIALHWGMTCANDTIEGLYTVPEPTMLGLLSLGLIGIGVSKRKNT